MHGSRRACKRKSTKPGFRALEACGDGFWELDLLDGSAWFSDWFNRRLAWPADERRRALADLQPQIERGGWDALMSALRDHLEKALPLDLEFEVRVAGERTERWQLRGSALRNSAGRPVSIAGNVREVSSASARGEIATLFCLRGAFEALPVAAALLDARARIIEANRLWQAFPAATAEQAIARLKAANSQTAIEFWLDQGEGFESGARQLRVRAIAFQHEGARHLAVTLEDRRTD